MITDIYRAIDAKIVTRKYIELDSTRYRVELLEMVVACCIGIPLAILITTYNKIGIQESIVVGLLIGFVFLLNRIKVRLCHKSTCFDRTTGMISIKRGFPPINKTVRYYDVVSYRSEIYSRGSGVKVDTFILEFKRQKYKVFKAPLDTVPVHFFHYYMQSEKDLLAKIVDYNIDDDKEWEAM